MPLSWNLGTLTSWNPQGHSRPALPLPSRWRLVVNATPQPLYPRERSGTHWIEGWEGLRTSLDGCRKPRLHRDSVTGLSQSHKWALPWCKEWKKNTQPNPQNVFLHHYVGKKVLCEYRPSEAWSPSYGLLTTEENAHGVHLGPQRKMLHVRTVTARLAGKFQVSKDSSQIHSLFVVASPGRHWFL